MHDESSRADTETRPSVADLDVFPLGLNPYENDPGAWGPSLLTNAEPILGCLEIAQARSVTEIGAYAGDFTRLLLRWAEPLHADVTAIDPTPQPELEQLAAEHADLVLVRETSLDALDHVPLSDAFVIDGDHNYHTVIEELSRIGQRSAGEGRQLPLLLLHDVGWPHGRRDDYADPSRIPEDRLQPLVGGAGLYPGVPGTRWGGLPYRWPAAREGGPRNGVLSAVEDFVAAHEARLELVIVPSFYGLGVVWERSAPYGEQIAALLAPLDRNPLIARLERNRVLHLASSQVQLHRAMAAEDELRRMEALFGAMLGSRVLDVVERFLRLRHGADFGFSKRQMREALRREGPPVEELGALTPAEEPSGAPAPAEQLSADRSAAGGRSAGA